jgi:hypothetical protein
VTRDEEQALDTSRPAQTGIHRAYREEGASIDMI